MATKPQLDKFYIVIDSHGCIDDNPKQFDHQKDAEAAAKKDVEENGDTGPRFVMGVVAAFVETRAVVECHIEDKLTPIEEEARPG